MTRHKRRIKTYNNRRGLSRGTRLAIRQKPLFLKEDLSEEDAPAGDTRHGVVWFDERVRDF